MDNEIIKKLNQHLINGIKEEKDVVYFFVQIRKLAERNRDLLTFPAFRFYSNWVVHPQINDITQSAFVIDKLNKALAVLSLGDKPNALLRFTEAVSFKRLSDDLKKIFGKYGIDQILIKEKATWSKFLILLLNVLQDLPLIPPPNSYKFIKEFRFIAPQDDSHSARIQILSPNGDIHEGPVVLTEKIPGRDG